MTTRIVMPLPLALALPAGNSESIELMPAWVDVQVDMWHCGNLNLVGLPLPVAVGATVPA